MSLSTPTSAAASEPRILATFRIDATLDFSIHGDDAPRPPLAFVPHAYLLGFQRERMHEAAAALGYHNALILLSNEECWIGLCRAIQAHLQAAFDRPLPLDPVRFRICIDRHGRYTFAHEAVPPLAPGPFTDVRERCFPGFGGPTHRPTFELPPAPAGPPDHPGGVRLDAAATADGRLTRHKTTARAAYDAARARCRTAGARAEALLVNARGEVVEGSLATPYFRRGRAWVTPPAAAGCVTGVTRRWALLAGIAREERVRAADVREGEVVWLSNGLRGFTWGFARVDRSWERDEGAEDEGVGGATAGVGSGGAASGQ